MILHWLSSSLYCIFFHVRFFQSCPTPAIPFAWDFPSPFPISFMPTIFSTKNYTNFPLFQTKLRHSPAWFPSRENASPRKIIMALPYLLLGRRRIDLRDKLQVLRWTTGSSVHRVICLGNRAENDGASLRARSAYSFSSSPFLPGAPQRVAYVDGWWVMSLWKNQRATNYRGRWTEPTARRGHFFSAPTLCIPWPSLIVQGCAARRCTRVHS